MILDEFFLAGEVQETSKQAILHRVQELDVRAHPSERSPARTGSHHASIGLRAETRVMLRGGQVCACVLYQWMPGET